MLIVTIVMVLGLLVLTSSAQILRHGVCPDVKPVERLDISKYMGIWYEQVHTRRWTGLELKCNLEYLIEDSTIGYHLHSFMYSPVANQTFHVHGKARFISATEAKMMVKIDKLDKEGEVWILGTDLTSYTVMYSCLNVQRLHFENLVIMTRAPNPDSSVLSKAFDILAKNKIRASKLRFTSHHECPHIDAAALSRAHCKKTVHVPNHIVPPHITPSHAHDENSEQVEDKKNAAEVRKIHKKIKTKESKKGEDLHEKSAKHIVTRLPSKHLETTTEITEEKHSKPEKNEIINESHTQQERDSTPLSYHNVITTQAPVPMSTVLDENVTPKNEVTALNDSRLIATTFAPEIKSTEEPSKKKATEGLPSREEENITKHQTNGEATMEKGSIKFHDNNLPSTTAPMTKSTFNTKFSTSLESNNEQTDVKSTIKIESTAEPKFVHTLPPKTEEKDVLQSTLEPEVTEGVNFTTTNIPENKKRDNLISTLVPESKDDQSNSKSTLLTENTTDNLKTTLMEETKDDDVKSTSLAPSTDMKLEEVNFNATTLTPDIKTTESLTISSHMFVATDNTATEEHTMPPAILVSENQKIKNPSPVRQNQTSYTKEEGETSTLKSTDNSNFIPFITKHKELINDKKTNHESEEMPELPSTLAPPSNDSNIVEEKLATVKMERSRNDEIHETKEVIPSDVVSQQTSNAGKQSMKSAEKKEQAGPAFIVTASTVNLDQNEEIMKLQAATRKSTENIQNIEDLDDPDETLIFEIEDYS